MFITTRPAALNELKHLQADQNWKDVKVSEFVSLNSRNEEYKELVNKKRSNPINSTKDYHKWDIMVMQAWGKNFSKFNQHRLSRYNDPNICWPTLHIKPAQVPTPMARTEVLAHNLQHGRWVRQEVDGVVTNEKWISPNYESIDVWGDITKPRMNEQLEAKIESSFPDLCETPVLKAIYRYQRTIAFLTFVTHRNKPLINDDSVRQNLVGQLHEMHYAPDSIKNLRSDDLYSILFESSPMLFVSNDEDLEWFHKTYSND